MENVKALNRNALRAGVIWAVILHLIRQLALTLLDLPPGQPIQQVVSGALFFIAFLSYPMLINGIMQAQTPVWRNPMIHATAGSATGLLGLLLVSAVGTGLWIESAVILLGIWLVLEVMLPLLRGSKFLKQEADQNRKAWRKLGELKLGHVLFLQIPEIQT